MTHHHEHTPVGAFPNPSAAGLAMIQAANAAAQKTLLSLQNVDNTSDANKPVSTATQTALNLKANTADVAPKRTFVALTTTANLTYNADHNATVSGSAYTVTLPAAATGSGDITLTNISNSANAITVDGGGANIIGASTYVMPSGSVGQYYSVTFYTDGTNWFIK